MKAAPVLTAFRKRGWRQRLVHTGQHYDRLMSDALFGELGLPAPDVNLNVGSGTHAEQTAGIMTALEPELQQHRPDLVVVYGDVNSTLAATLTAVKLGLRVAHVEAGVRSFDRSMPEETNRVVVDALAHDLFATSATATQNLLKEGRDPASIFEVGNVMIDALQQFLPKANASALLKSLGIEASEPVVLVTLHRAANTDDAHMLDEVMKALRTIAERAKVIFPVHPRTRARFADGATSGHPSLHLIDPVGYLEFLALQQRASLVITDSGGIQVESAFLGTPCLTLRDNTEWTETLESSANTLIGRNPARLVEVALERLERRTEPAAHPKGWDGHAAERIADAIDRQLSASSSTASKS